MKSSGNLIAIVLIASAFTLHSSAQSSMQSITSAKRVYNSNNLSKETPAVVAPNRAMVPSNDDCSGAIDVPCGGSVSSTTVGAAVDVTSCASFSSPGVWYSVTPTSSGNLTASLCGSGYDTWISAYSGTCASLACLASNDDFCGLQSQITFAVIAGNTYYILVNGYTTNSGTFTLAITCPGPPCVVTIPPGAVAETEVCSADANGGCNAPTPVYQNITCGETISGTSWCDGTTRDTDWFLFSVASTTSATITASAEFPFQIFFIRVGGCPTLNDSIVGYPTIPSGPACAVVTSTQTLTPGLYAAFLSPLDWTTIITCGSGTEHYYLTLTMPGSTPTITPPGPVAICGNGNIDLTSSAATSYLWSPGGETTQLINVTTSGNYTVTTTTANGCSGTSSAVTVSINASPTVSITGNATTCTSDTLTANATAGSGNITGYQWQLNSVDIPSATGSTYIASSTGSYTVVVTNSNGCSTTSAPFSVTASTGPTVNITGNLIQCTADTLTANTTGAISYQWQLNSSDISGATGTTYIATASGDYTVVVSSSDGCTSTSAVYSITVNAAPTVSIVGVNYACFGNSQTLTASATAGSGVITGYQWQESNVDIPGETNGTYSANAAGSYSVIVYNSNGCSTTSALYNFSIANNPTVSVTGNASICSGNSTVLTANATAGSGSIIGYQWQESNIDILGETDSTYTVTAVGSYVVIVTNSYGCTAASTPVVVTTAAAPVVNITGNAPICPGDSVLLTASSTDVIITYQWQLNSGNISGATDSTYYASAAGDYTVVVTNSAGCTGTATTVTVTISLLPTAGNTFTTVGDGVSFTNTSTDATTYSWDFGDGSPIDNSTNPSHLYTADGTYIVTMIACNLCSCDTLIDTVTVSTLLVSAIENSESFHIYPNPVSEALNIDFNSASSQSFVINVFNSLGQVIYSDVLKNVSGKIHSVVNVNDFAHGYYTLQITSNATVVRSKFIVQ
jgi:PKD repeat protein